MATTSTSFPRLRRSPAVAVEHVPAARAKGEYLKVPTFFGWTPGLRSLVAGHLLSCGCLVGVYLTSAGAILEVLDACGPACPHADHKENAILDVGSLAEIG